jgi:uncharacterized Zn finger protein (UPF0148 family)
MSGHYCMKCQSPIFKEPERLICAECEKLAPFIRVDGVVYHRELYEALGKHAGERLINSCQDVGDSPH